MALGSCSTAASCSRLVDENGLASSTGGRRWASTRQLQLSHWAVRATYDAAQPTTSVDPAWDRLTTTRPHRVLAPHPLAARTCMAMPMNARDKKLYFITIRRCAVSPHPTLRKKSTGPSQVREEGAHSAFIVTGISCQPLSQTLECSCRLCALCSSFLRPRAAPPLLSVS